MDYDEILGHLGESGRWHVMQLLLLCLPGITSGMFVLVYSFTGLEPPALRCKMPGCDGNGASYGDFNISIHPPDEKDMDEPDYCAYYNATRESSFLLSRGVENCPYENFDYDGSPIQCTREDEYYYDFENFEMDNSVVTDFDLVCEDQFKVALIGSIYMLGLLVSSFIIGTLADKIGRKPAIFIAMFIGITGSMSGSFANGFATYSLTRFITGCGAMGTFMLSFVIAVELVGEKTKTFIGSIFQAPFAVGEAIVCLIAFGIRDWRVFQLVSSVPLYLILLLWFVIPESPRWLIATKRYKRAKKTIEDAAKFNKLTIPPELLEIPEEIQENSDDKSSLLDDQEETLGFKSLFSRPSVAKNTIIMFVNWIVITLGYYGISMSVGSLGSTSYFLSLMLLSLIEIPSYVACVFLMDHTGRKPLFVLSLLITGFGCIIAGFMNDGPGKTTLAMSGKFGASAAFAIVYLYTAELYPTQIRSTAIGLCSTFARIGGIAAPQIAIYLPEVTFDAFPLLFMGLCALIGGVLAFFLPETLGSPFVETLDDIDELGKDAKPFFSWWSTEKLKKHMEMHKKVKEDQVERSHQKP